MARKRQNTSMLQRSSTNVAEGPVEQRTVDRLTHRFQFLTRNYRVARSVMGGRNDFNRSLRGLRRALDGGRIDDVPPRLDPEIEVVVGHLAKQHADGRDGIVGPADIEAGVRDTLTRLRPRRGRPKDVVLYYHVKAAVAAIAEAGGDRAHVTRYKNSVYDPQAANTAGHAVIELFRSIDASITLVALVDMIEAITREHADKPLRFLDIFPLHDWDGEIDAGGFIRGQDATVQLMGFANPIYFR